MQGAQNLRSEAYLLVRCNDSPCEITPQDESSSRKSDPLAIPYNAEFLISQGGGEAQRRRWTFYETIKDLKE